MSTIYDILAPYYDKLNDSVDYDSFIDFYIGQFKANSDRPVHSVLDIGCGTGRVAIGLSQRGYDVTGLDLSPDMLTFASDRERNCVQAPKILWTCQDMTDFSLGFSVDAVVCSLDGINHLPNIKAVKKCFMKVREHLPGGGIFIFDVNSQHKFKEVYGSEVYVLESEDSFCVWQNDYSDKSRICNFFITLFSERPDGSYDRADDVQTEKYYSGRQLEKALSECGFEVIGLFGDKTGRKPTEEDDRLYYVARAVGQEENNGTV